MRKQTGFTLIEIAIVLVIIGLLLGGVLKGQELITSARVRNLISQQEGIKAAYFGFLDRYRALPGDYDRGGINITGVAGSVCNAGNGNGNGRIEIAGSETILAWEHLSKAGFINGSFNCNPVESAATTPTNPFAVRLQMVWDNVFDDTVAPVIARHNLKAGGQIPSDLLAEVDRKVDDGSATGGSFRFSAYDGGAGVPVGPGQCYLVAAPNTWSAATVVANCGGATLF
ncbi:MAG: prepilin-type N-terminal cleavage/methylation domain-containing protein [Burkholderiales bacterium]